jgi:hypothetical protein
MTPCPHAFNAQLAAVEAAMNEPVSNAVSSLPQPPLYIVFAETPESYVFDRAEKDMTREATIKDLADGQFTFRIRKILEIGTGKDVTEDFAWAISHIWATDGEPLTDEQERFIELNLGYTALRAFHNEAA